MNGTLQLIHYLRDGLDILQVNGVFQLLHYLEVRDEWHTSCAPYLRGWR